MINLAYGNNFNIDDLEDRKLIVAMVRAEVQHYRRGGRGTELFSILPATEEYRAITEHSHIEAIAAMTTFSAGLIPFKLNRLTASVDPIKYYEYRSLDLPVISTRFGEMVLRDEETAVWLIDENSGLRLTSRQALGYRCNFSRVQAFRQNNLWATRFSATSLLSDARAGAPPPPDH